MALAVTLTSVAAGTRGDAFQSPTARATTAENAVFVGAGDIANCGGLIGGAQATASLLDGIEGTVFTAGDHAYDAGTAKQFQDCYEPTWGRHKARTRPTPGNHDYVTHHGAAYYAYFGAAAGPDGLGYYSYNLGAWHIVSLNSNIAADSDSAQVKWLRADLRANPTACTLAYWHIPVFSSGPHGNGPQMRDVWRVLYEFGVDVVINGHDHDYERFAPQDPTGKADPARGIREFVVGTGGGGVYHFKRIRPNSEVRSDRTYGVLKLTLAPTSYTWAFIPAAGLTFRDSGSAQCVEIPAKP